MAWFGDKIPDNQRIVPPVQYYGVSRSAWHKLEAIEHEHPYKTLEQFTKWFFSNYAVPLNRVMVIMIEFEDNSKHYYKFIPVGNPLGTFIGILYRDGHFKEIDFNEVMVELL